MGLCPLYILYSIYIYIYVYICVYIYIIIYLAIIFVASLSSELRQVMMIRRMSINPLK
jgi:hypothetical protein